MDQDTLRDIISDHAHQPRNRREVEKPTCDCIGRNPLCGDEVKLQIKIDSNTDRINDIGFTGRGCPISQASASLLTETCLGMAPLQAKQLATYLREQIVGSTNLQLPTDLSTHWKNVKPLTAVQINPARVKCVTLAWHTLLHALSHFGSTEIND